MMRINRTTFNFFRLLFYSTVIFLALPDRSYSQVSIQASIPMVGLVQKNQLWNLILVNGTTKPLDGRMDLILRDNQSGLELMTATTHRFILPKGSLQTNTTLLSPIQYSYLGMAPDNSMNAILPVGSYTACFSFIHYDGDAVSVVAEECVNFEVESLSPPLLTFPADSVVLDMRPSQFSWMPPGPAGMMKRLQYDVIIAEIKPSQQPAEALQENVPFYNNAGVRANFISYPASLPAFKEDMWYAWQIVARDGDKFAGKSDVWVFSLKSRVIQGPEVSSVSFLELKEYGDMQGAHSVTGERLNVKFHSYRQSQTVVVKFFNQNNQLIKSAKTSLNNGDNFLSFDLGRKFSSGENYTIEFVDSSNKTIRAQFTIN